MKATDITIGATYAVKVSGVVVPVQIVAPHHLGGWRGVNRVTGREVRVRSPQRCRYQMEQAADGSWRRSRLATSEETVRVKNANDEWTFLECRVLEATGASAIIAVPLLDAKWSITPAGMNGNIGGNDWRIYTLHPDDCARLCGATR